METLKRFGVSTSKSLASEPTVKPSSMLNYTLEVNSSVVERLNKVVASLYETKNRLMGSFAEAGTAGCDPVKGPNGLLDSLRMNSNDLMLATEQLEVVADELRGL